MSNNTKILIVVESIDVEDSSGSKGRVALIQNLHKLGYNLKVLHYTGKEISLPEIPCTAIKENRKSILFYLSRWERHLRYKLRLDLHKPLERFFGFSFTLFNDRDSIIKALRREKSFNPEIVLTLSKGGSFRPHHALLKMEEYHDKWLAYIHDPYPMHLYPRPYAWVEPGYHQKWTLMNEISLKARFTAFPSKLLLEWMGDYFPGYIKNGLVIPHQINYTEEALTYLPDYFVEGEFHILHAGNLLNTRNPKGLIEGFQLFLSRITVESQKKVKLILLGPKSSYSSFLNLMTKKIPQLYVSDKEVPFIEVQTLQNLVDINVILEAKAEISPFLPGKFPHCVKANKPILLLGPYYSESRRLLGDNYEYWAENNDAEQIAAFLERLYRKWYKDPKSLKLNRPDLEDYLSISNLKRVIDHVTVNIQE